MTKTVARGSSNHGALLLDTLGGHWNVACVLVHTLQIFGSFARGETMRIAIVTLTALAVFSWDSVANDASAGDASIRHHARKCGRYDYCGLPVICPSGLCASLYGAYGPYGGPQYWGRYTFAGWPFPYAGWTYPR